MSDPQQDLQQPEFVADRKHLHIEQVCNDDDLHMWVYRGTSSRLVISFSGIGAFGLKVPAYEFVGSASGHGVDSVLFVSEPMRTWLTAPRLIDRIVARANAVAAAVGATSMCAVGHSMGGFSALVMGKFLPLTSAVAFGPQYSVHPDVVGDDSRWSYWRRKIKDHRFLSIEDGLVDTTLYHVFHGMTRAERLQRDRFPMRDNLFHILVPNTGHGIPQVLRAKGVLHEVVRLALDNRPKLVRHSLLPLGGRRRTLAQFPLIPHSSQVPQ